jgi:two-component system KDP operon response regulator KdpE
MSARIMVIDDDVALRELIVITLSELGYRVRSAEDGAVALRRLAAEAADVVITDIFMPEKDGFEVINELRGWRDMPRIIAMSSGASFAGTDVLRVAMDLGAHETLPKPLCLLRLEASVRRQLAMLADKRLAA